MTDNAFYVVYAHTAAVVGFTPMAELHMKLSQDWG
jgi:hypothetical protein